MDEPRSQRGRFSFMSTSIPTEPREARLNNFNLLRLIFATLVIVSHAPEIQDGNRKRELLTRVFGTISFGDLAVDSFFILSGYLITKSWVSHPHVFTYLKSRVLRIYPGFAVASLLCAFIIGPIFGTPSYFTDFSNYLYLKSLAMLRPPATPPIFPGTFYPVVNGAMWSIYVEFCCYLFVLAFGFLGLFARRYIWAMLTLVAIGTYVPHQTQVVQMTAWHFMNLRCFMAFFSGGLFYLYKAEIPWRNDLAFAALALAIILIFGTAVSEVGVSLLWGYVILQFAHSSKALLSFNKLPDVSYGTYLYA